MDALEASENLTVTFVVIGIVIINFVTLLAIGRSRSIREETLTPLTVSVFAADLLIPIFMGFISIYLSWAGIKKPPLWLVRIMALGAVGNVASICSVTLLSMWQTIGITKPLQFPSLATRWRIWSSVALAWIWALIVIILRVASDEIFYNVANRNTSIRKSHVSAQLLQFTILSLLGVMVVCHVIIFVVVVRQHIKIQTLVNPTDQGPNPILLAAKSAKKILAVTITYILFNIARFIGVYLKNPHVRFFAMWILYSQAIWNSVMYFIFCKAVWKEVKRLFSKNPNYDNSVVTNTTA